MKQYLLRIDDEYFTAHLTDEEFKIVEKGMNENINSEYNIRLDKGGLLEISLIDEIKQVNIKTKEINLTLTKEEYNIIKECFNFHLKSTCDDKFIMRDGTIFNSKEEFDYYFQNILPIFKKEYIIHKDINTNTDIIFVLEVNNVDELDYFGYINNSLYTSNNKLLIHNASKIEIEDLEKGFGFSLIEHMHNDNIIYELTDLGECILSNYNYIVKFTIEE